LFGGKYRPALSADLQGTGQLPPWITFSRSDASTCASYFGSDGLLHLAAANVRRFDYDPVTLVPKGLLLEAAGTNIAQYSDFSSGIFAVSATLGSGTTAPTGGVAGVLVIPSVASSGAKVAYISTLTITASVNYVSSIMVKASGYNYFSLAVHDGGVTAGHESIQVFNLATGAVASSYNVAPVSAGIQNVGNGWWRVWIVTNFATTSYNPSYGPLPADQNFRTIGWTGDGTSGVYIFGNDIKLGSFPTSYIPTVAATTRSADVLTGAAATYLMNAWVIETGDMQAAAAATLLGINTGIGLGATTGNALTTADAGAQTTGNTATWTGTNRGGIAFDATPRVSINLNGGTGVTAANSPAAVTALYFGNTNNGASGFLNGHLRKIAGYTALPDAILQAKSVAGAAL
jgi:hypothetical protein